MQNSREPPPRAGGAGAAVLSYVLPQNPTALSYPDCRKLLSESEINGFQTTHRVTTYLPRLSDAISPGGKILTSTLGTIPTYLETIFPCSACPKMPRETPIKPDDTPKALT